jgi:hypothetical protein
MDQLSIDYAQEALREFSVYAERIEKKTKIAPKLVLFADGSGHIERPIGDDISFSGLGYLAKLLAKKNSKEE